MSATDAKNGDLKSLVRSGSGNGANGKDIPTLKSRQSVENTKSEEQSSEFFYGLTNPLKKLNKVKLR